MRPRTSQALCSMSTAECSWGSHLRWGKLALARLEVRGIRGAQMRGISTPRTKTCPRGPGPGAPGTNRVWRLGSRQYSRSGDRRYHLRMGLNAEACLEDFDAIARDCDLRALRIFQRQHDLARKPRIDLVNPIDIHQRRAVHTQKAARVQPLFKFGNRLVDCVLTPGGNGIGE